MYSFNTRIRYSETDETQKLTLEGLLNYFQDCTTFHSEDLGLGVDYLRETKQAWVLNVWQIDVERFPKMGERVKVCTAPYDFKGFMGFRNFWMEDEEGKAIAKANTLWTLLDLEKLRPVQPPQVMLDKYELGEKIDMEYLPRKIALPGEGEAKSEIQVMRHHLDTNHHVNNGQYVKMAMELMPENVQVKRLRVEYKKQAFLDEVLYPVYFEAENKYIVSLNDADGKPYSVVEVSY